MLQMLSFFRLVTTTALTGAAVAGVLSGCAASAGNVAKSSVNLTGCPEERLAVFNYEKKQGTWDAACGQQLFNCAGSRGKRQCTQVDPANVSPELEARVALLQQVPKSRRDFFVTQQILEGTWADYARNVEVIKRLSDDQMQQIDHPREVYTGFSAAFDQQLTQCVGTQRVARVAVSSTGAITPSIGSASCMGALALSPELNALKQYVGMKFVLAPGVRDLKLAASPIAAPKMDPAAEAAAAEAKRLEEEQAKQRAAEEAAAQRSAGVQDWLEGSVKGLVMCTGLKEIPVDVVVDEQGVVTVTLQGKLNTKLKQRCVENALGAHQIEAGPALSFPYVVGAPKPVEPDSGPGTTPVDPTAAPPATPGAAGAPSTAPPPAAPSTAAPPLAPVPPAGPSGAGGSGSY